MPTKGELRDLWEAELQAEAEAGPAAEPEPHFEIARLRWMMPRQAIPVLVAEPETTWIWSDLHLGDQGCLSAWERPFPNVRAMDRELLRAWRGAVRPGDTVICLGDVAHPDFWRERRNIQDLRACPGRRVLVLGNHDIRHREDLRDAGFSEQHVAGVTATSPRLALTHVPVKRPPITAWNVHGHTHGVDTPGRRHVNVSVEGSGYRPVRLADVLARIRERQA